jgi:hypothetical protein
VAALQEITNQEITKEFAGSQEEQARLQAEREANGARAAALRRHANENGSCFLAAASFMSSL